MTVAPGDRHSIRFLSGGVDTHRKVFAAIRATGVECWEAGPGSSHDSDIRNAQRWADAAQYQAAVSEVARLRATMVQAIAADSVESLRDALGIPSRLPAFDWHAA